jgi:hypothetical protein
VLNELNRLIRVKPQSYDDTSLEFGNVLGRTDKFEDRVKRLLKREAKKKATAAAAAVKRTNSPAPTLNKEERDRMFAKGSASLKEFRAEMRKGPRA